MTWFRPRRRPAHPPLIPAPEDENTANVWGLTLTQWQGLTDFERSECRRNITTAPKFQEAS